ncbi:hypothetical protein BKA93DRAFT_754207 [Sparassis latifolia]
MKRTADSDIELALPSPAASTSSPTPSVSELPGNTNLSTTTELGAPPRKRARGETSVEERKEARAHRNRIAAQNSRDRRKAQFAYLERRVAELEEENRQLRAGMGLVGLRRPQENSDRTRDQERERDAARDRENAELKERIKTLETGWDAVVKALAASGLPLNVPSIAPSASDPAEPPSPSSQPPTTTFSVFVPPSPIFPISPPPSHDSSLSSSPFLDLPFDDAEPTRHLARVANTDAPPLSSVPQQRLELDALSPLPGAEAPPPADVDEGAMADLFREILAPSPVLAQAPLPDPAPVATAAPQTQAAPSLTADWTGGEMQRLLDMCAMQSVGADGDEGAKDEPMVDFPSALDLELGGWDPSWAFAPPEVGVF